MKQYSIYSTNKLKIKVKLKRHLQNSNSKLRIERWSENTFLSNEKNWQKLLAKSNVDQLFLSWRWLASWWHNWSLKSIDSICILAAYEREQLVGIAPLYLTKSHYLKGIFQGERLQFIGTRLNCHTGISTEYLDFICEASQDHTICQALLSEVYSNLNWSEFILNLIKTPSILYKLNNKHKTLSRARVRTLNTRKAYSVNTTDNYQAYLKQLGKNTRLRLYNRRKVLASLGDVQLETKQLTEDCDIFSIFNSFAAKRWSHEGISKADIKAFISGIQPYDDAVKQELFSSVLSVNGLPISAIINVFCYNKIYNIQLCYEENFNKKISLGTLHIGYAIERAFESDIVVEFDLLAGEGKNTDYKKNIAECHSTLQTLQVIRGPLLRFLYFINDYMLNSFYRKLGINR